ncbi:MAG: tRNA (guanosine(37)-N1)-methyltransferase TrmD [bacterium]|nr:tRNA (guanosine(37)-N1)-methyltransferase TrmD [bacterium]
MRFDILTLFPDMLEAVLGNSIIGRARTAGLLELNFIDIRDFTKDKHRRVDDTPFSGGGGMLMQAQPIYDAYMSIANGLPYKPLTIYMSPQGRVFDQKCAVELSNNENSHIVILCGHYEGVDQRVLDEIIDTEISIGDFVLTGGEIPAMAVIDAVSRLIPGVLAEEKSYSDESHFNGLLEYPQYTKPREWHGIEIPEILLSGHHANIVKWKHEQSLINTFKKRPDMLETADLNDEDIRFLEEYRKRSQNADSGSGS